MKEIVRPGLREEHRAICARCLQGGKAEGQPCWGRGIACRELAREQAQVEAERMEIYEGGPLPDANFFDHDQE